MYSKELTRLLRLRGMNHSVILNVLKHRSNELIVSDSVKSVKQIHSLPRSDLKCKFCDHLHNRGKMSIVPVSCVPQIQVVHAAWTHSKTPEDLSGFNDGDREGVVGKSSGDQHIKPALDSYMPNKPEPSSTVNIVPGKGAPPQPPIDCCQSGCPNCVWLEYAEELKQYYSSEQSSELILEAMDEFIDDPGLKMFLKIELGLM